MANYLKVNSQDHASSEEGFIEICQEPSCFNHPFESVPIVLPELLKCCKITVNPLLAHVLSMVEDPSVGWREGTEKWFIVQDAMLLSRAEQSHLGLSFCCPFAN